MCSICRAHQDATVASYDTHMVAAYSKPGASTGDILKSHVGMLPTYMKFIYLTILSYESLLSPTIVILDYSCERSLKLNFWSDTPISQVIYLSIFVCRYMHPL